LDRPNARRHQNQCFVLGTEPPEDHAFLVQPYLYPLELRCWRSRRRHVEYVQPNTGRRYQHRLCLPNRELGRRGRQWEWGNVFVLEWERVSDLVWLHAGRCWICCFCCLIRVSETNNPHSYSGCLSNLHMTTCFLTLKEPFKHPEVKRSAREPRGSPDHHVSSAYFLVADADVVSAGGYSDIVGWMYARCLRYIDK
jgi:hypothetical protein